MSKNKLAYSFLLTEAFSWEEEMIEIQSFSLPYFPQDSQNKFTFLLTCLSPQKIIFC
jgi:hypothetical protein